jgi:hypothetical protein
VRGGSGTCARLRPVDEFLTSVDYSEAVQANIAFGYVGRPWKPAAEGREVPAEQFAAFDEPGYAKVVMDFSASPTGGGALLRTETCIQLTDEHARRAFGRY